MNRSLSLALLLAGLCPTALPGLAAERATGPGGVIRLMACKRRAG